jgi:hypothetical protein
VYQATLGAALLQAISDLCPSIDSDDLVLDIERGATESNHKAAPESGDSELWISEQSPGGNGHLEEFMRRYAEDPRRFFAMARAAVEMGEFELIDDQFGRLLQALTQEKDSPLTEIISNLRSARGYGTLAQLSKEIRTVLVRQGFSPFHGFMVSINNRILRPGASSATDRYLASAVSRWDTEERRLGIEIDLRIICYWLSQSPEIESVVSEIGVQQGGDAGAWRMSAIYGLLWGRGRQIRQAALQLRNPFMEMPNLERLLVVDTVGDERTKISVDDKDWLETSFRLLSVGRLVTLISAENNRSDLNRALGLLICNPVEGDYFRSYARLQAVRQVGGSMEADVELVEAVQ